MELNLIMHLLQHLCSPVRTSLFTGQMPSNSWTYEASEKVDLGSLSNPNIISEMVIMQILIGGIEKQFFKRFLVLES